MRRRGRVLPVATAISALLMTAVYGASLEDGKAVFARREDTMKHMGRPLYLGVGRVVQGTVADGPDPRDGGGNRCVARRHARPELVSAGVGSDGEQDQTGDFQRRRPC